MSPVRFWRTRPKEVVGWWWITLAYAMLIVVLSVIPPHPGVSIGPLDKPLHLCEYLLLAWCVVQAAFASGWSKALALTVALLLSTGLGTFLEGVQGWLPYRQAEWLDLVANIVGAGLGVWLGMRTSLSSGGESP